MTWCITRYGDELAATAMDRFCHWACVSYKQLDLNSARTARINEIPWPFHDVSLACQELHRCVTELGAVGSFLRPNLVNGHFWHSNYWDPLYDMHEELKVTLGFHEGTGAQYSHMNTLYGENRFYRHVASHWIEMQQALIAMIIGGVFEFHPTLRVGFLEAQNSWVPGILTRIEWDYPQYHDSHAPYLSLTPKVLPAQLLGRSRGQ